MAPTDIARADDPMDLSLSASELEAYREHSTSFIADTVEGAGADEAIVALSGGIDSTLTATLAVEALGTGSVYGLVLPSEVNRERNMTDAERVAGGLLGIEYDVVEIGPIVEAVLDAAPASTVPSGEASRHIAVGNLRARLRAVLAYLGANGRNAVVLGTGNRSEALVGYFTKYGDGAVDCSPIGPLYKQQVRQLARYVGVPEDLAAKTASAELWVGQTDEAELGIDYETLDSILALHVDGPLSVSATATEIGIDPRTVERVSELHERSEHKRQFPPSPDPRD
ncbi:NAD+ synthase [Halanaeroarchaeum sulfurireducens]|uniref:NH(3)-dependent NAD(+) synthetase n=1 Tax=Halanaeroarchaeum sulfurireducens TaxID=1604004 RepID=A0A0F7P5Y7_9EURY|nr:NAD+ synthase [Halanaeroarchaeum sulfurireducens]AKH96596.1 NAD synthetase [Halanaeroarchaeum sulfurireducens]ALG80998.1 NAD synthetase [Halanaeroarchaeum sulfurireducens]